MKQSKNSTLSMIKLGLILSAYAVVSCTVLALVNNLTSPVIKQNQINKANQSMKIVFNNADSFEEVTDFIPSSDTSITIKNMYLAKKSNNVIGAVTQVEGPTYDRGTVIIGVDLTGTVTGLQILELSDSPGFGLKANDPTFFLPNGKTFYGQFSGLKVEDGFKTGSTIDAISGATITSKGIAALVTQGTYSCVKYLEQFGGSSASADAPEAGEEVQIFDFDSGLRDIIESYYNSNCSIMLTPSQPKSNIVRNMLVESCAEVFVSTDNEQDYTLYTATVRGQTYGEDGGSVIVVVNEEGVILGCRITELNDSANYGMNAAKPSFYSQFTNKNAIEDILAGSYDAVSGASITSDCIADMVKVASYVALSLKDDQVNSVFVLNEHYLEE